MQAAAEQSTWQGLRERQDALAQKLLEVNVFCAHRQASLARKPSILGISNLATALVRMAHTIHTTKFQSKMEQFLDRVAASVDRRIVGQLPPIVAQHKKNNARLLDQCRAGLKSEDCAEILSFLNDRRGESMDGFQLTHWCCGDCCADDAMSVRRCKHVLEMLVGHAPETPLLYRWKFFEPAVEFAFRGITVHRLLVHLLGFVLGKSDSDDTAENDELLDIDNADLDPATRQRVRMHKTWQFFTAQDCLAPQLRIVMLIDVMYLFFQFRIIINLFIIYLIFYFFL